MQEYLTSVFKHFINFRAFKHLIRKKQKNASKYQKLLDIDGKLKLSSYMSLNSHTVLFIGQKKVHIKGQRS